MNSLPPAVAYGRIEPRKKPAAASIRPPTRPDAGLASSVGNSTGYWRAHAASTFWILVRVCGSPEISACVWSMTGGTSSAPMPTTAATVATTALARPIQRGGGEDRKSTRLNSSHVSISYAVFCLKKKKILAKAFRGDLDPT